MWDRASRYAILSLNTCVKRVPREVRPGNNQCDKDPENDKSKLLHSYDE